MWLVSANEGNRPQTEGTRPHAQRTSTPREISAWGWCGQGGLPMRRLSGDLGQIPAAAAVGLTP